MSNRTAEKKDDYKLALEVATFDWKSTRIQFFLGFLLTLVLLALVVQEFFATRFLPQEYIAVGKMLADGVPNIPFEVGLNSNPLFYIQLMLFNHHAWWYRTVSFVVTSLTAMSVGLITLDITIRYGNRIGASSALFAALLYLLIPHNNSLTMPVTMLPALLANFFGLFAVFLDLRFRLLRENGYYLLALLSLILAGVCDSTAIVVAMLGLAFSRSFIAETEKRNASGPLRTYVGLSVYFLATMLFLVPHSALMLSTRPSTQTAMSFLSAIFSGETELKYVQKLLPILTVTTFGIATLRLVIGSLWLRPILFALIWSASSLAAWSILNLGASSAYAVAGIFLSPPVCILLALAALPAVDTLNRKARLFLTFTGSCIISAIVVLWGVVVAEDVRKNYDQARELGLFKVELTKRMEKTAGKLAIINPPLDFVFGGRRKKLDSPGAALVERRDREDTILQAMLCSPLTGQPLEVETNRRLPSAFIRVNKVEQKSSSDPAAGVTDFYVWSYENGRLMPIYYSGVRQTHLKVNEKIRVEPDEAVGIKAEEWAQVQSGEPFYEFVSSGVRLNSGSKKDITVWLPMREYLDPTKAGDLEVTCTPSQSATGPQSKSNGLSLVFKGKDSDEVGSIELQPFQPAIDARRAKLIAETKGIADWNKHNGISALGVRLSAGSPSVVVESIDTAQGAK